MLEWKLQDERQRRLLGRNDERRPASDARARCAEIAVVALADRPVGCSIPVVINGDDAKSGAYPRRRRVVDGVMKRLDRY